MSDTSKIEKLSPEYIALQLTLEMIKTGQIPPGEAALYYKRYLSKVKEF